ncbi:MAG: response regulator transcription factor [Nostoc sp. TH1S01]|nr:response regulator transcription factor [Nostoc sp. TH1S01]
MRILLIEDDEIIVGILLESLSKQHYIVDIAKDGHTGWEYANSAKYNLILMDVGLPKVDGISLCQRLRSQGCATPILLMTAKDAKSDRIRGLDAGADDYLIKPLDLEEFQAKVRALLRRSEIPLSSVLQVGALQLNPNSCEVSFAGQSLSLTPKEYNLLELFLRNPKRVFSRGEIIDHLWTLDDPPQEESVKSHIKSLRQKLKTAGAGDWIENVYGVGYRLNPQAEGKNSKGKTHKSSISQTKTESTVDLPSSVNLSSNPQTPCIDPNQQLAYQVQPLVESIDVGWKQITNLETVNSYLQTASPNLVVLSIDEAKWQEAGLTLLLELTQRQPLTPVLVLPTINSKVDNMTVEQAKNFAISQK